MNIALNSALSASSSGSRVLILAHSSSLLTSPSRRSSLSRFRRNPGSLRLIRRQSHVSRLLPGAAPRGILTTRRSASSSSSSYRPFTPVMEWQDCMVKMDVDLPASAAYNCYSDREAIPQWMPFISSVKILEDKPDLSRWSLKYKAFGQNIEFAWLARNLQPIPNQKIHWRSMEGLPNKGAVRFYPKGPSACTIELTVSYEVPQILIPVASALQPFLESLLARGLEKFARFAKTYQPGNPSNPSSV